MWHAFWWGGTLTLKAVRSLARGLAPVPRLDAAWAAPHAYTQVQRLSRVQEYEILFTFFFVSVKKNWFTGYKILVHIFTHVFTFFCTPSTGYKLWFMGYKFWSTGYRIWLTFFCMTPPPPSWQLDFGRPNNTPPPRCKQTTRDGSDM